MPHLLILRGTIGAGKSTLATILRSYVQSLVIIEIDDIKVEKHGSTERCSPEVDFQEAGLRVKAALERGFHTVVIEPFCSKKHFSYFLEIAEIKEDFSNISIVWLNCSLKTAIKRKGQLHSRAVIFFQILMAAFRYRPSGEEVFETDYSSQEQIAAKLSPRFGITPVSKRGVLSPVNHHLKTRRMSTF